MTRGQTPWRVLLAIGVASLVPAQCRTIPATVLLRVQAEAGLPLPDELRLTILSGAGVELQDRRLPPDGKPTLPSDAVLYPRDSGGVLRLLVRALAGGARVGEGATTVLARAGEQVAATITLRAGALADRDGDGVPDAVDNCPDLPNPDQRPCAPDGAPGEMRPDGKPPETSPDIDCDRDKDGHRAIACGGDDCDDNDGQAYPGKIEGPPGNATCSDGRDNDCDGLTDVADPGCRSCTTPADCNDNNTCTSDSCAGGLCQSTPTNTGLSCDDGNPCTTATTCIAGKCGGGAAVVCPKPANPCEQSACVPQQGCVVTKLTDGSPCDDGKFCSEGTTCTSNTCGGGTPRDCNATAPSCHSGTCSEPQKKCLYSPLPAGSTCDDGDPCTQGETCAAGTCTPPPLQLEVVDSNGIGWWTTRGARLDSKGFIQGAIQRQGTSTLRWFTNASGAWVQDLIDSNVLGVNSAYPAIALDAQDHRHVVYFDNAAVPSIKYATEGATAWQISTVGTGSGYTSLGIDAAGKLHASFQQGNNLVYAVPGSGGWVKSTADQLAGKIVGVNSALFVDTQGKIHITHAEATKNADGDYVPVALRYTSNAPSWSTVTPANVPTAGHGSFSAVVVSPGGDVFITHSSSAVTPASTSGTLYLTSRIGGIWKTEALGNGAFSSIVLDTSGKPHIAYRDPVANQLRYTTNASGSWASKTLDTIGADTSGLPNLMREPSGRMHVVYKAGSSGPVKHAVFSACP